MISQEREPALGRIGSSRSSPKPARDRRLREIETQLEQLPVNARRFPGPIVGRHTEDQGPNLRAHPILYHPLVWNARAISSTAESQRDAKLQSVLGLTSTSGCFQLDQSLRK